jgi:hypothetical protein
MSWQIPTQIEQDIIAGKATYRTFQTGNGGQSILPVPANAYVVIFGYDFSPAGGGFKRLNVAEATTPTGSAIIINDNIIRGFETQQISFYTGTDFYPFIHHIDCKTTLAPKNVNATAPDDESVTFYQTCEEIDTTPISRQLYITSANDVTITHGLIVNSTRASGNAIPVTSRTPQGLTYGGSAQVLNTQTNYGPAGTPQQFMQPSPKDYQDFAFGLLPNNADGQAFATPDPTNGLVDSNSYLNSYGVSLVIRNSAATQYYLNLHYALYSKTIPETRG